MNYQSLMLRNVQIFKERLGQKRCPYNNGLIVSLIPNNESTFQHITPHIHFFRSFKPPRSHSTSQTSPLWALSIARQIFVFDLSKI